MAKRPTTRGKPGGGGPTLSISIAPAAGQSNPATSSPINFTITFSHPVRSFTARDIDITSTAEGTPRATLSGVGPYNAAISGMTGIGTITISIPAARVQHPNGSFYPASNRSSVSYDDTPVVIEPPPEPEPEPPIYIPPTGALMLESSEFLLLEDNFKLMVQ